jgi:hypothetical protein
VDVRKILSLGVLTYLVFGIISLFQLGIFLPPLPLKPTLVLTFVILALFADRAAPKGLRLLLGGFILFYVVSHSSFWETFLSYEGYLLIQEGVETYFLLIAAILLPIFNYLFLLSLIDSKRLRLILHIVLLLFVPFFIINPSLQTIDFALIGMAILYFLIAYSPFIDRPGAVLFNTIDIFIAVGLINMMDNIVYLVY